MKKIVCLALVLLLLLAACGQKEPPQSPDPAAPGPASPGGASEEPPPESEGENKASVPAEADEDLKAAVEAALAQYRAGTVEVSDQFPAPPEGFAFPETLDWETLTVTMEETGYLKVAVPSAGGSQEMRLFCSVFGAPDTNKTETHVSFILFE